MRLGIENVLEDTYDENPREDEGSAEECRR